MYEINIEYPLVNNWREIQEEIEDILGESVDSGAGFGMRDLQFETEEDDTDELDKTVKAVEEIFTKHDLYKYEDKPTCTYTKIEDEED